MSQNPSITIETVTPSKAAQMLGTATSNRQIRKSAVNRYARDMIAGKWMLNGEAIKFDRSGRLVDGQHRLSAVIAAKKDVQMLVIRGVIDGAMLTLDTGVGRSFHDASHIAGTGYSPAVAPIARWWLRYEHPAGVIACKAVLSHNEIAEALERHPSIPASAEFVARLKTVRRFCVPSVQGFVHAYATEKYDREFADLFMQRLNDGTALEATDPIFLLRRYLVEDESNSSPESYRVLAVTIKAWNAWLRNDVIQRLVWRGGDEPFPKFTVDRPVSSAQRYTRRKAKERIEAELAEKGARSA